MTIPPSDLVLIDTGIWVGFFNRNQSAERITVDPLLDDDRAAITGMILAEILQGFRRDEQADWVASSLKGLHDLAIAAIALRNNCFVLTTDPHFDLIAGLKRFPLK